MTPSHLFEPQRTALRHPRRPGAQLPPLLGTVLVASLALLVPTACAPKATQGPTPETSMSAAKSPSASTAASRGVQDPNLAKLLEEHWDWTMQEWPTWASRLGDLRFHNRLTDQRPEAYERRRTQTKAWLERAQALDPEDLGPNDRLTLALFIDEMASSVSRAVCRSEEWSVSPWSNALDTVNRLPDLHRLEDAADGAALLDRYRAFAEVIDGNLANLTLGLESGRTPNRQSLNRLLEMLDREISEGPEQAVVHQPLATERKGWTEEERSAFDQELKRSVNEIVWPALKRYRSFLQEELLPKTRPEGQAGMSAMPDGEACYAAMIHHHTSLQKSAQDIHQTGLNALEGIHNEFETIGERLWGEANLQAVFERLRSDPELFFSSSEEVEKAAREALEAAQAKMKEFFGILPKAECIVRPIPDYEAPYSTIAYYRGPNPDGSKPGEYFINTHAPETRPRAEAKVLAYHESIPGHHLQIAIAQELEAMPAFRRHMGTTAYVEGWALYTERLSDEMGLYADDLDRLGMLSFDAWRASRLVVDTGIHALGWTREQAETFLAENTPLAENNIKNEVDRYINWPGQALAYKLGQLEILGLRNQAQQELGSSFSLPDFHDVVLSSGAVSLSVLRSQIEAWIKQQETERAP